MRPLRVRLAALAVAGMAVRAFYTFVLTPNQKGFGDWIYYNGVANGVADGQFFIDPFAAAEGREEPSASHAPLYPLVLSLVSLAGGTQYLAHRAAGILLGGLGIVVIGLLARRVAGDRVAVVAAAIAALYPIFIAADGALLSETLYTPVLAATLLCAYRVLDAGDWRWAAALGALVGLCALTRSEAVLLVPLLAVPVAWGARPGRAARLAAVVVAFALVLAPWTIRNLTAFDSLVPVSTQGGALIAGANCPDTYFGPELGGWSFACLSKRPVGVSEAEQSDVWRREGIDYARDHAGRIPVVVTVRVLKLLDFYEPRRQLMFAEGRNHTVEGIGIGVYYLLLPLAVLGGVLVRRRREPLRILMAPVAMVLFAAVTGYGVTRLRHAAELAIVVLAALALVHLADRLRERRGRRAEATA